MFFVISQQHYKNENLDIKVDIDKKTARYNKKLDKTNKQINTKSWREMTVRTLLRIHTRWKAFCRTSATLSAANSNATGQM